MALLSSPWHAISSTPPATRAFTLVLVILSAANSYLHYSAQTDASYIPYLTLVPGSFIYFPWTLITAGFVETHFFELLLTLLLLPACLRYLERLWGAIETLKFIAITLTISNIIALVFNLLEWIITGNGLFIYHMDYHGQMALQTAVLVAFTQLIPEHQLQFFGAFNVRVKRLPMFYVGISNILCILGYQSPWILIQFGWLVSWTYLRFYKRTTDPLSGLTTYGDRSETFAFIQWFPPFVHTPLSAISKATHDIAIKLKLIRPFSPSGDPDSGGYIPLSTTAPGLGRAEAERRRALALKALDQRLASSSGHGRGGTPARNGSAVSTSTPAVPGSASSLGAPPATKLSNDNNNNHTTTIQPSTATTATTATTAPTTAAAASSSSQQPARTATPHPHEAPRKSEENTV